MFLYRHVYQEDLTTPVQQQVFLAVERLSTYQHHKQRLIFNIFEIFYFLFCLKSQPYIHKYLITTFNKEYITLQWIQTSTFFKNRISQHLDILHRVMGLLHGRAWAGHRKASGSWPQHDLFCSVKMTDDALHPPDPQNWVSFIKKGVAIKLVLRDAFEIKWILCRFLACTYLKGVRRTVDTWMWHVESLLTGGVCRTSIVWTATRSHAPKFLRHL